MKIEHTVRASTIIKVTALTTLTRLAIRLAVIATIAGLSALAIYINTH